MRFLRAPGGSESLKMSINIVLPVPTPPANTEGVSAAQPKQQQCADAR